MKFYSTFWKEKAFYQALLDNGVSFEEPEFQTRPDNVHGLDYDNPDHYHEKLDVPFPPDMNRIKRRLIEEKENWEKIKYK